MLATICTYRSLTLSHKTLWTLSRIARHTRTPLQKNKIVARFASSGEPGRNEFGAPTYIGADRPMSPDVKIYKFPLPAVTSILFRATGVAAVAGMVALSIPVIFFPTSVLALVTAVKGYSLVYPVVKLLVAFPLVYHTLTGLRHIWWDYSSRGLDEISEVDQSSRRLLIVTGFITILLSFINF